jgi:hypothetical protein
MELINVGFIFGVSPETSAAQSAFAAYPWSQRESNEKVLRIHTGVQLPVCGGFLCREA